MDKVIVLSSDDEDDGLVANLRVKPMSPELKCSNDELEFDYGMALYDVPLSPEPEVVPFSDLGKAQGSSNKSKKINQAMLLTRAHIKPSRAVHDLSDSDDADEGTVSLHHPKKQQSSDDELPDVNIDIPSRGVTKRNGNLESKMAQSQKREERYRQKELELSEKAKKKEEKERKKKEEAHAKALKKAADNIKRAQKPGECMKWVSAILDPNLLNPEYSGELLNALRDSEIDYKVEDFHVPSSVSWERRVQSIHVGEDNAVQTNIAIQREPYVLVVWMWSKIIEHIHDNSLKSTIADMISLLPGCEITLAIYGLESYFRFQKTQKNRNARSEVLGNVPQRRTAKEGTFEAAPTVSRGDVEMALAELQVVFNMSHRCMSTEKDLTNLVCQFSKAVAQAPYKREELQKFAERLDWYAVGDSKDCVAVDKDGNGSLQLWLRQLCQFPLASRETSEAIASEYPSPISLLMAYEECANEQEAQSLLQDIPVRRGPGPLCTTRRIGPQLSRKIHAFFTTFDQECLIEPD